MDAKYNPLAERFDFRKILKFTLPNTVMMIFCSLYTIVDGMFISRLAGELSLSATNMFYPVMSVEYGIGIMIGTGGSAVIAMKLGMNRDEEAREDLTALTLLSIFIGFVFTVLSFFLLDPALKALGTTSAQMAPARAYARGILSFAPMMFLQMVFQVFFVTAGRPRLGLLVTVLGGLTNVMLDWLFMGPCDMGVGGAALATGLGWSVPAVYGLFFFTFDRKGALHFTHIRFHGPTVYKACTNGSSEMVSNVSIAVTTFMFNIIFMRYWREEGIAALTILSYFQFVFISLYLGFSVGISPVISYKYGAGDTEQLRTVTRSSMLFILISSALVYFISVTTSEWSIRFFVDRSSPVFSIAYDNFHIYALQFIFAGISIFASSLFTSLGNGLVSGTISFLRTFLFLVIAILVLPELFGETGVWISVPAAETAASAVAVIFLLKGRRKYHF